MSETVGIEKQMLEFAQIEWTSLADVGSSYSPTTQKEVSIFNIREAFLQGKLCAGVYRNCYD